MTDLFGRLFIYVFLFGPIALAFFLGWRFVRALERRKGSNLQLNTLTKEVQALRTQASLMTGELADLDRISNPEVIRPDRSPTGAEGVR